MQALKKRHIKPGHQFDKLIPRSIKQDSVIRPEGKAQLHHTINLIKHIVPETTGDTRLLANYLKGSDLRSTCQNIWEFVYNHIQYARDKKGIEQVRRPSRVWADRIQGVDCDCYSVFISSILTNLNIPHKLRITKYGGKSHFQHIYPIVKSGGSSYITIDCVTDQFDYEVPYSGVKDFDIADLTPVGEINGVIGISGVDEIDLQIHGISEPRAKSLSLRQVVQPKRNSLANLQQSEGKLIIRKLPQAINQIQKTEVAPTSPQEVKVVQTKYNASPIISKTRTIKVSLAGKILMALGVGLGTYKLTQILT